MPPEPTVPVSLSYWLLAATPIAVLLVLLVALRWTAAQAGPTGFLAAAAVAVLFFRTPAETLAVGAAKGFWNAMFILYIIWAALALYEVARAARVFDSFRHGIRAFTPNQLVQLLAFGLVFVTFMEATTGFGTPIAVVAPLLVGLGLKPLYAVSFALIGHVWASSFAILATPWLAVNLVVDVVDPRPTLVIISALLTVAIIAAILTMASVFGGRRAIRDGWLLIVVLIAVYGGAQMAIAPFIPQLGSIVPATLAMGAVYAVGRLPTYQRELAEDVRREVLVEEQSEAEAGEEQAEAAVEHTTEEERRPPLALAFSPYLALVGFMLLGLALTQLVAPLGRIRIGFGFPETATGHGITRPAAEVYSGLNPISHPGTAILLSLAVGYLLFSSRGYLAHTSPAGVLARVARNAVPTSVAVVGFLAMSSIMEHSGQVYVLAQGMATVLPATLYAGASVLIGILGAFMTSSSTASNILFSPLQSEAAETLGLSQGIALGGQVAGAAYGNAIAPVNVAMGTATTRIAGQEGAVLREILPWALIVGVVASLILMAIQILSGL